MTRTDRDRLLALLDNLTCDGCGEVATCDAREQTPPCELAATNLRNAALEDDEPTPDVRRWTHHDGAVGVVEL